MTPYKDEELAEDWEFKILRSGLGAFKKPERLRGILEEERRAGWVLVEKFDDNRIRLKRPASAKERDPGLDIDPYRTGLQGEGRRALIAVVVGAVVIGLVVLFFVKFAN